MSQLNANIENERNLENNSEMEQLLNSNKRDHLLKLTYYPVAENNSEFTVENVSFKHLNQRAIAEFIKEVNEYE